MSQAAERERRIELLREEITKSSLDAMLLTDQSNFEYFTGYRSLFWTSKSRPFYALVFADGGPSVIVASAAEARTVAQSPGIPPSVRFEPYSGFAAASLEKLVSIVVPRVSRSPTIGIDHGDDHFGRGSLILPTIWAQPFKQVEIVDGSAIIWAVRMIKSEAEVELKRRAMKVATNAFFTCLETLQLGDTEQQFGVALKREMLALGAEGVPWLPVRFGRDNMAYSLRPTERRLTRGDFIWVDIGCVVDGSMSDVNRIAKAGTVTAEEQAAYGTIRTLTLDIIRSIRPGMTGGDVFRTCQQLASATPFGPPPTTAGRIGHGSGIDLTEPPSIMATSGEVLAPGMVIHIEPKYETSLGVFQLEEVAVIRQDSVELLTVPAPEIFPTIKL